MLDFRRNTNIVDSPVHDWQALAKKLSEGIPLGRATIELRIPYADAVKWAEENLQTTAPQRIQLNAVAESALQTALEKLTSIATREADDELQLDAAKALASLAIQALKISGTARPPAILPPSGGAKTSAPTDPWDAPGNWDLTKPK